MKVAMTLLVRDEKDIIEANIQFHLNSGVDIILVIDNDSVDGTRDILDKYKKTGKLKYWIEKNHTYEQDKWVSFLAKKAAKMGADVIFHCDADEFWFTRGNLKKIIKKELKDILFIPVINYLPPQRISKKIEKISFNKFSFTVSKTEFVPGLVRDRVSSDLLFYTYPNKVMTTSKYTKIGYGNDTVLNSENAITANSNKIRIYHFPIRGFGHFKQKVINGGSSYLKNPVKNPSIGWHWKKWYQIYKKNGIRLEYKKLTRSENLNKLIKDKMIKKRRVPLKIKFTNQIYKIKNKDYFKIF